MDESGEDEIYVPHIHGVQIGITFLEGSAEPVIVLNMAAAVEDGDPITFFAAFAPQDLQNLIPDIVDAVVRARTVMEMITIWPEKRDEILKNISFRWTGQVVEDEDGGNGPLP